MATISSHSCDPRVALTDNVRDFKAACLSEKFRASILRRSPNQKEKLENAFRKIVAEQTSRATQKVIAEIQNNRLKFTQFPDVYEQAKTGLKTMLDVYHELTNEQRIGLFAIQGFGSSFHTHAYAFMNCTLLNSGRGGTEWDDEKGKIHQVDEGDWFFFKEGFRHRSPKESKSRITLIIKPPVLP